MNRRHPLGMGGRVALLGLVAFLSTEPGLASYRDKNGNEGTITFLDTIVNDGGGNIDYTVTYEVSDSEGFKSGEYAITSQMLPGRGVTDDFVLSVLVLDDASSNAAELIFRNHPDVAPAMPILRLLDCSTDPCTEVKVYDDPKWGCWIIQDQSDIADYPIELLDARVILKLLEPAQLAMLPNLTDGTGNWAEIMENHRTNFSEALFRADTEHLGVDQSDLLTSRMIAEIEDKLGMGPAIDWLERHFPGIDHGALTFLTGHRELIEDMTTVLFNKHLNDWPLDYSFPFGRMPIFLIDPHSDAGPDSSGVVDPFHQIPTHWERVIGGQGPLGQEGCWHDWPENAYSPLLDNGDAVVDPGEGDFHIGQYECAAAAPTATGFVDRPCDQESDYSTPSSGGTTIGGVVEGSWHNPIHGVIGGSFGPPGTTAGTMIFWVFHTYASTNALANWRHAQRRDMGTPNQTPECDANGPYVAECAGATTDVALDGGGSSDPDGDPLTYLWTTDCPGGSFDDDTDVTPTLTVDSGGPWPVACAATLEVTDDFSASAQCDADVTVDDTTPPEIISVEASPDILWPPNHKMRPVTVSVEATDTCSPTVACHIVGVSSNEPVNGPGDGNTSPDWVITGDLTVDLRAERSGEGKGRFYTLDVVCTDEAGNESDPASTSVLVPHNSSQGGLGSGGSEGSVREDGGTDGDTQHGSGSETAQQSPGEGGGVADGADGVAEATGSPDEPAPASELVPVDDPGAGQDQAADAAAGGEAAGGEAAGATSEPGDLAAEAPPQETAAADVEPGAEPEPAQPAPETQGATFGAAAPSMRSGGALFARQRKQGTSDGRDAPAGGRPDDRGRFRVANLTYAFNSERDALIGSFTAASRENGSQVSRAFVSVLYRTGADGPWLEASPSGGCRVATREPTVTAADRRSAEAAEVAFDCALAGPVPREADVDLRIELERD